jgi:hypothetical protein
MVVCIDGAVRYWLRMIQSFFVLTPRRHRHHLPVPPLPWRGDPGVAFLLGTCTIPHQKLVPVVVTNLIEISPGDCFAAGMNIRRTLGHGDWDRHQPQQQLVAPTDT